MDFKTSLAAQAYGALKQKAPVQPKAEVNPVADKFADFASTLAKGEETAKAVALGQADMQSLVEALSQSQLAIETAVAVRDKVVEAYQDIMRMPMSVDSLFDVMRQGLWVAMMISLPVLAAALIVGLVVGILQALTSVQEMTLTFVPKLGAILGVFWVSMDFMTRELVNFYQNVALAAVSGG